MHLCQDFRHILDIHMAVPTNDPCNQNHPNNADTRRFVGGKCAAMSGCPHSLNSTECLTSECLVCKLMVKTYWKADPVSRKGFQGKGFQSIIRRTSIQTQPIRQESLFLDAMHNSYFILHILPLLNWPAMSHKSYFRTSFVT
jgi:hypothetical protein